MVIILLLFLGGFLLDKYVLWPSHMEKIDKIVKEVTLKLTPENRQQVREIVGRGPNSSFTHNGIEVEQYRFSRGIPGFKRPMLDIAFDGDTIAFFRQDEPIDEAFIDSQRATMKTIDSSNVAHPGEGEILGLGGGRRRGLNSNPNSEDAAEEDDAAEDADATEAGSGDK